MNTVRELVIIGKQEVAFREVERRALQPHEVRVRSLFGAAKHGTEMAFFKGYAAPRGGYDAEYRVYRGEREGVRYPFPAGNICVGEVIEAGSAVTRLRLGDRVFNYGSFCQEHVWPESVRTLRRGRPGRRLCLLGGLSARCATGMCASGRRIVFGLGAIGLMAAGKRRAYRLSTRPLRRQAAPCGATLSSIRRLRFRARSGDGRADVHRHSGSHAALAALASLGARWQGLGWAYPAGWTSPRRICPGASFAPQRPNPTTPTGTRTASRRRLASAGEQPWSQSRSSCRGVRRSGDGVPEDRDRAETNIKLGVRFRRGYSALTKCTRSSTMCLIERFQHMRCSFTFAVVAGRAAAAPGVRMVIVRRVPPPWRQPIPETPPK